MRAATTVVVHPGQSERLSKGEEATAARTRRKKKSWRTYKRVTVATLTRGTERKRERMLYFQKKKKISLVSSDIL